MAKKILIVYFLCCINLEESLKKVVAAGGEITQPIFSFPGGQRVHILDVAVHELAARVI